jgi:hypothetical protein
MRIRAAVLEAFGEPLGCATPTSTVDPFLSHRLSLDEVNRGFELMHAQDGIRSVIEFS